MKMVKTTDEKNTITQTALLQRKIFNPSIMPNGIRLKREIQAFRAAPTIATNCKIVSPQKSVETIHITDKAIFVRGPAIAVFPNVSLLMAPEIITAPGEIILNGDTIEIKVINAPNGVRRNSAQSP